jgi:hypothetical protein
MELLEAIAWVAADTRNDDPDFDYGSDHGIIDGIREYDHNEITGWVETGVIEGGGELEAAYRMVIDAEEDDIEEAFGNTGPICPMSETDTCPADATGCTRC